MKQNFIFGIQSLSNDIKIFMDHFLHNKTIWAFAFGLCIAVFIIGFILTKNPKHIPIILRYSSMQAFEKVAKRHKNGTYEMAFIEFLKIYTQVRTLTLITVISFFTMITTIVISN